MKLSQNLILTGVFGLVASPVLAQGSPWLNNDIPQATTLAATAHWFTPVPGLSVRAQYYSQGSDGSLNIGAPDGPPAHPDRFPEVAEEVDRLSVGTTYSFGALSVSLDRFDTRDGRNTGISMPGGRRSFIASTSSSRTRRTAWHPRRRDRCTAD